jgi:hypothetical protein
MHRTFGRSPIGERATIETPFIRGGNITIVAVISPTRGLVKYLIKMGSVNSIFKRFIK